MVVQAAEGFIPFQFRRSMRFFFFTALHSIRFRSDLSLLRSLRRSTNSEKLCMDVAATTTNEFSQQIKRLSIKREKKKTSLNAAHYMTKTLFDRPKKHRKWIQIMFLGIIFCFIFFIWRARHFFSAASKKKNCAGRQLKIAVIACDEAHRVVITEHFRSILVLLNGRGACGFVGNVGMNTETHCPNMGLPQCHRTCMKSVTSHSTHHRIVVNMKIRKRIFNGADASLLVR